MLKERIFSKSITLDNFKIASLKDLGGSKRPKGRPFKKEAELIAQVFYTPRGFSCGVEHFSPIDVWSGEQFCRIEGVNEESPEGDLNEKYFDTKLAAMHFITKRLKRLGWDPMDSWSN